MPHACDICSKEFSRKANLVRHREGIHGGVSESASEEVVMDPEAEHYRPPDIFDDASHTSTDEDDAEPICSSEDDNDESMMSQHEEEDKEDDSLDEDNSVMSSPDEHSTTETEDDSESENTDWSEMGSSDEGEEHDYDSGDEEEWTLYRDWTIPLPHYESDVPQRVIKETKRAGKTFYLINFAALPHRSTEIVHSKNWVSEQTLMKKYGYLVLK